MNVRIPDALRTVEVPVKGQFTAGRPVAIAGVFSPGNQNTTRKNMLAYATIPSV